MIKNVSEEDKKKIESKKFSIKDIIFIVIGLACVVYGGDLTVDNATVIAKAWGLSDRFNDFYSMCYRSIIILL